MRARAASLAASLFLFASAPAQAAFLSLVGSSTLDVRVGSLGGDVTVTYLPFCQVTFPGISSFPMNQPVALGLVLEGRRRMRR